MHARLQSTECGAMMKVAPLQGRRYDIQMTRQGLADGPQH